MRKDSTKKLLIRNDRYYRQMIDHDIIAIQNIFETKATSLDKKNTITCLKNIVQNDGKKIEFNMIHCRKGYEKKSKTKIDQEFLLGQTEVTQEFFQLVMGYNTIYYDDSNDNEDGEINEGGKNLDQSKHPIGDATWLEAIEFCNKLSELQGFEPYYTIMHIKPYKDNRVNKIFEIEVKRSGNGYRLPFANEWKYAAKAGTDNTYAGCKQDQLQDYAWYKMNSDWNIQPVATKKPNEWGFYDMSGNVYEWCDALTPSNTKIQWSSGRAIYKHLLASFAFGGCASDSFKHLKIENPRKLDIQLDVSKDLATRHTYDSSAGFRIAKSLE